MKMINAGVRWVSSVEAAWSRMTAFLILIWLVRIVINECYAIMRREKRLLSLEDVSLEQAAQEEGDYSDLYEAVSRLPHEIRLTVTLYYMEGYRIKRLQL